MGKRGEIETGSSSSLCFIYVFFYRGVEVKKGGNEKRGKSQTRHTSRVERKHSLLYYVVHSHRTKTQATHHPSIRPSTTKSYIH